MATVDDLRTWHEDLGKLRMELTAADDETHNLMRECPSNGLDVHLGRVHAMLRMVVTLSDSIQERIDQSVSLPDDVPGNRVPYPFTGNGPIPKPVNRGAF